MEVSEVARAARLFPEGGWVFGRTFVLVAIAEEEIARAKRSLRRESARRRADSAFALLMPGELRGYCDAVYRSHAREIIGRVARREDARPATAAECLVALSRGSLIAPPDSDHCALHERLFGEVMGAVSLAAIVGDDMRGRKTHAGAVDELLAGMRRRLADPKRALP